MMKIGIILIKREYITMVLSMTTVFNGRKKLKKKFKSKKFSSRWKLKNKKTDQ